MHCACIQCTRIDPLDYGWEKSEDDESLQPSMLPVGIDAIPKEVIKLMACGCQASEPCAKGNCSCRVNRLGCSIFCKCLSKNCFNPHTTNIDEAEDMIDENDEHVADDDKEEEETSDLEQDS